MFVRPRFVPHDDLLIRLGCTTRDDGWVAVFPTLTVVNLLLGDSLADVPSVLRTFVLATAAVPIAVYGLMSRLHELRARLLLRRAART